MLKVFIEPIERLIELNSGINTISIENPQLYRKLYFDLDNSLVFSKDDKIIPSNKIIVVVNPLDPDINSKKNLSILYKSLEATCEDNEKNELKEIEAKIISLISKITLGFDVGIEFDDELDFNKLFNLMKIRFSDINCVDYLELLINYIKIIRELTNSGIIVFYGLSSLLTNDEYNKLFNEIKLLDVQLLDICNTKPNTSNNIILVDEDYCIL